MRLAFFHIPVLHPQPAQDELNQFLASRRVSRVDKAFVADPAAPAWSVVVTWIEGDPGAAAGAGPARHGRVAVDYKALLSAAEFALYDRLRQLRRELAQAEGLPPYAVFTNEQLAALVQQRVTSEPALAAVEGVGEGRLARYGAPVLALLRQAVPGLGPAAAAASA